MIFDSHIHIFNHKIISNVQRKQDMVRKLKLQTDGAEKRNCVQTLSKNMQAAGVEGALMLPTANAAGVQRINRECIEIAAQTDFLKTAGTLHPDCTRYDQELAYLRQHHVRIIKLCSFSQGFVLNGPNALKMFDAIQAANMDTDLSFAVILDTLYSADYYFGTRAEFNTSPKLLAELTDRYPDINFIGAHMGGLDAPYAEIRTHLTPRANLYLDTSNAAHTLTRKQFCDLVARHGSRHILFGTDWPWFSHEREVKLIADSLNSIGFSENEKNNVFYMNIATLLGM